MDGDVLVDGSAAAQRVGWPTLSLAPLGHQDQHWASVGWTARSDWLHREGLAAVVALAGWVVAFSWIKLGTVGRVARPVVGSEKLGITTGTGHRSIVRSVVLAAPGGWLVAVAVPVGGAASHVAGGRRGDQLVVTMSPLSFLRSDQ